MSTSDTGEEVLEGIPEQLEEGREDPVPPVDGPEQGLDLLSEPEPDGTDLAPEPIDGPELLDDLESIESDD